MDLRNLISLFDSQSRRLGPRIALRHKRYGVYRDVSWSAYREMVRWCASALMAYGIRPGDRVGLLADNRLEWLVADLAIMAAGAVNVPPHAPLTAPQIRHQFLETAVRWVFLSNSAQLEKIVDTARDLPTLEGLVVMDGPALTVEIIYRLAPIRCFSWEGFLQNGRLALGAHERDLERRGTSLTPDELATIMYTSGTTGNPKGVMLTHGNLLSNARSTDQASPRPEGSVLLNWLPFSHIYARTVDHYLSIVSGLPLCLAESVDTLVQNLREVRPTHMSSVPRFYEKALGAARLPGAKDDEETTRRLRGIFGGRIDYLSSGGAPLPLHIAEAFQKAGLLVLQGYGLTESSPVISFNRTSAYKLDTVGQPIDGVEVKIAKDGEVLTRGPHVMKGYWKDAASTAAAIRDGWLYTGDLGRLDGDGFLTITGRKKELLVLSSGKKVVPNHIEGLVQNDPCIDQAVLHGEGKNFVSALIVPNWPNLRGELSSAGFTEISMGAEALAAHPAVYQLLETRIARLLEDVSPWERIKRFVVLAEPFSVAAGELTVSLKLRRQVVLTRHHAALEALYE